MNKTSAMGITEKIKLVDIDVEMKNSYIDYAMSVIVGRALPNARDGLKPVHRRILYAMNDIGLLPNKPYKKSARIVGEVLGKYHPHGDTAVYDSMVRMVQPFSLRYPLVDGQGNFGSVDGDSAAAMRYTEARLQKISLEILQDINKNTVDFSPNFDDSLTEPVVLPAKIPNLLVNGSSGIAVGMATNIPPHNLIEVIDGTIAQIDNPDITIQELMEFIPGPDFPTGGFIYGKKGILSAYKTGRGIIKLRAKAGIERKQKRDRIIVTELPYNVNKAKLIETIARLVKDKKLSGISEIRDESDRDGMRIVIEIRRNENADVILNQLYKHTQMQDTFGIIILALVNNRPRVLTLKDSIKEFIEHRREIVTRRIKFDLTKAEDRAHILEGLKIALDNIDAVIKTIRASKNVDEARNSLMNEFELTSRQAQAILDMRLQKLTSLEVEKLEEEYLKLIQLIEELRSILASPKKIDREIKKELIEVKEKYGDERRTEIVEDAEDFSVEDLIAEEQVVVTISRAGYIKRLPITTYKRQRRGGKGITAAGTKEEDFIEHLFITSTHNYILFFTDGGKCFWLKVFQIPVGSRTWRGKAIINLIQVNKDEKITAYIPVSEFSENYYITMITKLGLIKKTNLTCYSNPRVTGIIALNLKEGDELMDVKLTDNKRELLIGTANGKALRFSESQARPLGRTARGVKGISLKKGDRVIGAEIVDENGTILTVTENGYGKRSKFEDYRNQNRGGMGIINIQTDKRNGQAVSIMTVYDDDEIMIITESGIIIRSNVKDISVIGRNTKGVRLIRLNDEDRVAAVAKIAPEDKTGIEEDEEIPEKINLPAGNDESNEQSIEPL